MADISAGIRSPRDALEELLQKVIIPSL